MVSIKMHNKIELPDATPTIFEKFERGDVFSEKCPSREVLTHATSRWGALILVCLLTGTHRFSELRRKINGISEKMLAQTLQALERDGFVERISYPVIPPHVEYKLSPLGHELAKIVLELVNWVEANLLEILAAKQAMTKA